ncbi:hypothetical protein [Mesobacterium pallidum]|uniref:hypothetical protein n=1 Tax=Mesobacterium pallidum TaxID=2872037 RepID=UPI001EE1AD6C|nr:hypothetical protein [Mesobacterium pallidum]
MTGETPAGQETGTKPSDGGKVPSVKDLLGFIGDKDARLGLLMAVFVLFLTVGAWFVQAFGGNLGVAGVGGVLRMLGTILLGLAGFVIFFKAIDGTRVPQVIVWYATALVLLTTSIAWMQTVLRTPVPLLIEARCFANPWHQGCPLGPLVAAEVAAVEVVPPEEQSVVIGDPSGPDDPEDPDTNPPTGTAPAPERDSEAGVRAIAEGLGTAYTPDGQTNRVFVQFAGALSRDKVIWVSKALRDTLGWNVQGADSGGERTAAANGVDQVRYFRPADRELAMALARAYNALGVWDGFEPLSVALLRGFEGSVPPGHLEVWTSVD